MSGYSLLHRRPCGQGVVSKLQLIGFGFDEMRGILAGDQQDHSTKERDEGAPDGVVLESCAKNLSLLIAVERSMCICQQMRCSSIWLTRY